MQRGSVQSKGGVSQPASLDLASGGLSASELEELNRTLAGAVLSGFSHFGNKSVVESLLYILELEHSVNIFSLASNLDLFRSGINSMFGSGGYILEEKVCDELARKLGVERNGRSLETLVAILIENLRDGRH